MSAMAHPTLKIDNARYVVTLDPERRIVRDGAVLVEGGRIARVGKAAELAAVGADRVIDARRMVVTPGFEVRLFRIAPAPPCSSRVRLRSTTAASG